jgi:hypothetical protein
MINQLYREGDIIRGSGSSSKHAGGKGKLEAESSRTSTGGFRGSHIGGLTKEAGAQGGRYHVCFSSLAVFIY